MAYTTIDDPTIHFNTVLFTGTASGNKAVTGVGFQPDFVWTKNRVDAYGHNLYDSVRGTGKYLQSNGNSAESSSATSMVSFDSDGFTVGTGDNVQYSSNNGVSWNWKAGGSASSNSDGSITSSVSANTTAGFSIVKYTTPSSGTSTVGHGLGVVPNVWIHKRLNDSENWQIYHHSLGNTKKIMLNTNGAESTSAIWQDTTPTSSVMYLGTAGSTVFASSDYIAYCFAEKQGYSKFGKWTGNGNADGPFIYTGFRPAWILRKEASNADVWIINDTKRSTINNGSIVPLYPHLTSSEPSGVNFDFLSNGFKIRNTDGDSNTNNATFIYFAFAEAPFTNSNGVPCNAR